jgi:hypothetical protein
LLLGCGESRRGAAAIQAAGADYQTVPGRKPANVGSQFGTFTVDSLPLVSPAPAAAFSPQPAPSYQASPTPTSNQPAPNSQSQSDVFTSLERLGQLHQSGILSDDEFRTKKAELLARL